LIRGVFSPLCPELHEANITVVLFFPDYWRTLKENNRLGIFFKAWFIILSLFFFVVGCSSGDSNRLRIGDQAPDYTIADLHGGIISSAGWNGSPVILRFWDTECKYCRADTPIVNRFFDQYQKRGLKVLYVAMATETIEGVESFTEDLEIVFPVALDRDGKMAADYQVRMVPQTVFISPDQKIITAILGGVGEAELDELVGEYLKE
jgi:peroxiredoxin